MSIILLLAIIGGIAVQVEQSADQRCTVDRASVMAMAPREFDQGDAGWRPLGDKPDCQSQAADLIRDYRRANWRSMTTGQVHSSYWHEGQMRAVSGDNDAAIPLLMAGTNPSGIAGAEYELGTIAFLRNDLPGLRIARERLAAYPLPNDWEEMRQAYLAAGVEPIWPPNLDILDGLMACFGKPYSEAYGGCGD